MNNSLKIPSPPFSSFGKFFFILLVVLVELTGCYDPDDYKPEPQKQYLESHVVVNDGGNVWEVGSSGFNFDYPSETFYFGVISEDKTKRFSFELEGYGNFTNPEPDSAIHLGKYQTVESSYLRFRYAETIDGTDVNHPNSKRYTWSGGGDSTTSFFTISNIFSYDDEIYLSGSYQGYAEQDFEGQAQTPYSIFLYGTYDSVRVDQITR